MPSAHNKFIPVEFLTALAGFFFRFYADVKFLLAPTLRGIIDCEILMRYKSGSK